MTILWSLFVPGVLLLLLPADWLMSSVVQLRSFDCFQSLEDSPRHRPWWWVPVLWLDPLRGFFGAFLLKQALGLTSIVWASTPKSEYALLVAVLALGVVCQILTRRGDRDVLLAPIGFVVGVAAALTPWPVMIIGTVVAALGLFALRQFHWFFVFGFIAVALLGFVLGAAPFWIWPASAVFALPIVTAVVLGRTLELPTRNASGPVPPPHASAATG